MGFRQPPARLYVGSSGFSYPSWKPGFYPPGMKPKDFLRLYAERLPAVELNATFYRLPSEQQLGRWAAVTPPGFRFAVKASRQITHAGRLELVPVFSKRVRALGERLGPVLVQLPPSRPRDSGLLRLLLDSLDPELRYAFELRHESWAGADLGPHALVGSLDGAAPFRYLRLRQPPYDEAALAALASRVRPLLADGVDVYAFFKHEDAPDAPRYAARLRELCETARPSANASSSATPAASRPSSLRATSATRRLWP
ncbi:MAG TPA: DUF72 domain-containing protein [Gaiellaceae bacterium]|nr:DUF72 domain-containing protein [Gaiellaceae bacterium]